MLPAHTGASLPLTGPSVQSARGAGGLVVRCGGFQWLDRQHGGPHALELDLAPSAPASLRPSPHGSRKALGAQNSKTTVGAPARTPSLP